MKRTINLILMLPLMAGLIYLWQSQMWIWLGVYFACGVPVMFFDIFQRMYIADQVAAEQGAKKRDIAIVGFAVVLIFWPIKLVWMIKRGFKDETVPKEKD